MDDDQIAGDCFDPIETAVLAFTYQVVADVRPSDAVLAGLRAVLSDREVAELTLTVGFYMLMARLMETTGVDMDAPPGQAIIDALGQQ